MRVTYYVVNNMTYPIAAVVGDRWFHFEAKEWRLSAFSAHHWFLTRNTRKVSSKYAILRGQYLLTEQEYKQCLTKAYKHGNV